MVRHFNAVNVADHVYSPSFTVFNYAPFYSEYFLLLRVSLVEPNPGQTSRTKAE